ncbi:MAG: hypothetical protein JNK15_16775 [Planctomycetes bacterium]|nr:hypothetical protein [Planctomycetota bacterium]
MNMPPHDRRPDEVEHTKYSPGLLFFYLSCAGVSLGAAIGFGAYKFFDSTEGLVFGLSVSGISCVTCYFSLRAARRPPAANG